MPLCTRPVTPGQRRVLLNLADHRLPHFGFGMSTNGGVRGGVLRSLRGLERRGLALKSRGRWVLTDAGHEAAGAARSPQ